MIFATHTVTVTPTVGTRTHSSRPAARFGLGVAGTPSGPNVSAKAIAISTPQAGGHPDITTEFTLEHPGEPEAAQNVVFNAPTGIFGNPRAATECKRI